MANGIGTATVDFGSAPGSAEASVAVTGQAAISATSKAEAFFMGDDSTGSHDANDHRYAPAFIGLTCGTPTASTGFTIYARAFDRMQGQFALRWVWSD